METISVNEAAKRLNIWHETFRQWLRSGDCPFGYAIQTTPHRYTYIVFRKPLEDAIEHGNKKRGETSCQTEIN